MNAQPQHLDTYFLDPEQALQAARQENRVQVTDSVDGLQICYYGGETPHPMAPPNMVHVPINQMTDFLTTTRLRFPKKIEFPPNTDRATAQKWAQGLTQLLNAAQNQRLKLAHQYAAFSRQQDPQIPLECPYRIFMHGVQYTTVMQYSYQGLASALRKLGHEVLFLCDENDMECIDDLIVMKSFVEFKPHIYLSINGLNTEHIHPKLVHVTWWQDPMPQLKKGELLPWRERDLIYSFIKTELLINTGAQKDKIRYQPQCIDRDIFYIRENIKRENKAIFVGGSGFNKLQNTNEEKALCHRIVASVNNACNPTREDLVSWALEAGVEPEHAVDSVWYYAVRAACVRWLCHQSDLVEVEVYGRFWEHDEVVAPFFRGPLPHGIPVAKTYNSATFALCVHESAMVQQRLPESVACGCIPLVYNNGGSTHSLAHAGQLSFFKDEAELRQRLSGEHTPVSQAFLDQFTYDRFAARIIKDVQWTLKHDPEPALRRVLAAENPEAVELSTSEKEQISDYLFTRAMNSCTAGDTTDSLMAKTLQALEAQYEQRPDWFTVEQ